MTNKTQAKAILLLTGAIFSLGVVSCKSTRQDDGASCCSLTAEPAMGPAGEVCVRDDEAVTNQAIRKGKAIAGETQKLLGSHLMQAVAQGGFTNALSVCSVKAMPLTRQVAGSNSVDIARVTHKARNPHDRANTNELALIRAYLTDLDSGNEPLQPVVKSTEDGQVTFYAPIILNNPLCLNCHGSPGSDIQPNTLAAIGRIYPEDEATGFKLGDLRGLWRIKFSREELVSAAD